MDQYKVTYTGDGVVALGRAGVFQNGTTATVGAAEAELARSLGGFDVQPLGGARPLGGRAAAPTPAIEAAPPPVEAEPQPPQLPPPPAEPAPAPAPAASAAATPAPPAPAGDGVSAQGTAPAKDERPPPKP